MKRCKHVWRAKVELFLDIPLERMHRLSKVHLRSRHIQIDGAGWDNAVIYCAKCGVRPE